MSLYRFVYYSAVIGGWAAFLAWGLAEGLLLRGAQYPTSSGLILTFVLVGTIIGGGLTVVAGMSNAQWKRLLLGLPVGLFGGAFGGAVGGLIGNEVFASRALDLPVCLGLPIGWMLAGLAIGSVEGVRTKSVRKWRNGAIGGTLGGLLGGFFFFLVAYVMGPSRVVAARAAAFTILGVAVGALIGLAHLILKEAWLTVVDGFRPGRELILDRTVTVLGRGDHLPLPLLGYAGRDLDPEHARIVRQPDGTYSLEDNRSRMGTRLNGQPIRAPAALADGDLIKLGTNIIRFNHRHRGTRPAAAAGDGEAPAGARKLPPLPPPPAPPGMPGSLGVPGAMLPVHGAIRPPAPPAGPGGVQPPAAPGPAMPGMNPPLPPSPKAPAAPRIPPPPPPPR